MTHNLHLLKYTLRYLKGTSLHGLHFPISTTASRLTTFIDEDNGKSADRKPTSGAAHYVYDALLLWHPKKKAIVVLSTCEAEYIAGSRTLQHTLWLRQLLDDMTATPVDAPALLLLENASATKIPKHPSKTQI